jgi:hypothetical protein
LYEKGTNLKVEGSNSTKYPSKNLIRGFGDSSAPHNLMEDKENRGETSETSYLIRGKNTSPI